MMNAPPFPKKDGEHCSECGGSGWTRYFSETTAGGVEEAFRLCERCKRRPPCEAGSANNKQPLPRDADQDHIRSSLVLIAVLKTSAIELRAAHSQEDRRT